MPRCPSRTRHLKILRIALMAVLVMVPRGLGADGTVGALDDFEPPDANTWDGHSELTCGYCPFPLDNLCQCPPPTLLLGHSEQIGGPIGSTMMLQVNELPSYGIATWNQAMDRTGDFMGAGVGRIEMDLSNLDVPLAGNLTVRVGVASGATIWVTSDAFAVVLPDPVLPAWSHHIFHFVPDEMTRIAGTASLASVLGAVDELRIFHASVASQWDGEGGPNLGIDNIELPEPGLLPALLAGVLLLSGVSAGRRTA